MKPQRKFPRKVTIPNIKILDLSSDLELGHIGNFSLEGMMVISRGPIQANRIFRLKLLLPKKVAQKDNVTCDAECKWCKKKTNLIYNSGFHFTNISTENARLIDYWFHDRIDLLSKNHH